MNREIEDIRKGKMNKETIERERESDGKENEY